MPIVLHKTGLEESVVSVWGPRELCCSEVVLMEWFGDQSHGRTVVGLKFNNRINKEQQMNYLRHYIRRYAYCR